MVSLEARERAGDKIARLAGAGLDVVNFWNACAEPLESLLEFQGGAFLSTLDPASLLYTSCFNTWGLEGAPDFFEQEYLSEDANHIVDVARTADGISTIHEATNGDPSTSPRWHSIAAVGGDQELIAVMRNRAGEAWACMGVYRVTDRPHFDDADKAFLRSVMPFMAEGARRALQLGDASDPEGADAPGLVVLDDQLRVESMTPGVERWVADLPDGNWSTGKLPSVLASVAGSALRSAGGPADGSQVAMARVMGRSGDWIVVHGAAMVAPGSRRVAVILEPAHPAKIANLLMSIYGLTDREKELTRLVLQGFSTAEIATTLFISANTVQTHLRTIFEKTGVRSRRDLVGKVFFSHYEPRVQDNLTRKQDGLPLRGGPAVPDLGSS